MHHRRHNIMKNRVAFQKSEKTETSDSYDVQPFPAARNDPSVSWLDFCSGLSTITDCL